MKISSLVKEIYIEVYEAFRSPNRNDQKRTSLHQITVKMPRVKNQGRILKAEREKYCPPTTLNMPDLV
jgi:hypothetical protein